MKQMSRESCGAKRNLIIYLAQLDCQASKKKKSFEEEVNIARALCKQEIHPNIFSLMKSLGQSLLRRTEN